MSFLDKLNAKPVNSAAGADAQKKPVNPFLGKTINPFAEMLKKQQEKKKEEKAPEAKAEEPAAEEKKSAPAKEEVKPEPAPVIKDEPESKKEEKKLDEPEKKQEEVKEEAPSEPKPAEEKKEEEPKVETEEKTEEEKPKKKTRKRATRKTKKAAAAEEEKTDEEEEAENDESAEVKQYSMDEVMSLLSTNKSFDEASDILMSSLDDDDWIELRDKLAKRIQDVHIDADLNPGAIKFFIDELDALYTEVKLYLIKTTASLDRITNKQTGVASIISAKTLAGIKGRPSPAQKENAVNTALSDVVVGGTHLNLLALLATGQARKTVLSGFMDIIKSKKDTLITASSMLKIENTAINPPRI